MKKRTAKTSLLRTASVVLALCALLPAAPAKAAAKKASIYVVKSVEGTDHSYSRESYTYTYNENGRVSKCKTVTGTLRFTYKNGRLVKVKDTPKKGIEGLSTSETKYKYDSKGRISSSSTTDYDTDKTTTTVFHYGYNKKGQLVSMSSDGRGSLTMSYNKAGLLKKSTAGSGDSSVQTVYQYDDKGNIKKETTTWIDGKEQRKTTRKYTLTYNKAGRLTEKKAVTTHSDPEFPKHTMYYTITYQKIRVPKADLAKIREEQQIILHSNILSY